MLFGSMLLSPAGTHTLPNTFLYKHVALPLPVHYFEASPLKLVLHVPAVFVAQQISATIHSFATTPSAILVYHHLNYCAHVALLVNRAARSNAVAATAWPYLPV